MGTETNHFQRSKQASSCSRGNWKQRLVRESFSTFLIFNIFRLDLQNVDITLRILFRPQEKKLPWIYANIGSDYDERVLPSITTEVLKGVVVSVCKGGVVH